MSIRRPAFLLLACAVVALVGVVTACDALETGPGTAEVAGIDTISVEDLPPEARTTLGLIEADGPFPYSKDGGVFHNYEGLLPQMPDGYYREYTVVTPGSADRGARRMVAGQDGEHYYTDDHYRSFRLVVE